MTSGAAGVLEELLLTVLEELLLTVLEELLLTALEELLLTVLDELLLTVLEELLLTVLEELLLIVLEELLLTVFEELFCAALETSSAEITYVLSGLLRLPEEISGFSLFRLHPVNTRQQASINTIFFIEFSFLKVAILPRQVRCRLLSVFRDGGEDRRSAPRRRLSRPF